ncbi:insulin-like peptide IlO1_i1 [Oculina patagonica]
MNMKLGFAVFLLLLLVVLPGILGRKCHKGGKCKINENSPIPVDLPHLCGDHIIDVYKNICNSMWAKRRRRREMSADVFVQTKHEAQDFLSFRRRKRDTDSTDVIEECCGEGCRTEELKEYC